MRTQVSGLVNETLPLDVALCQFDCSELCAQNSVLVACHLSPNDFSTALDSRSFIYSNDPCHSVEYGAKTTSVRIPGHDPAVQVDVCYAVRQWDLHTYSFTGQLPKKVNSKVYDKQRFLT